MKDFPFANHCGSSSLYVEIREVQGIIYIRKQQELLFIPGYQSTSGQSKRLWFPKDGFGQSLVFKMALTFIGFLLLSK